MDQLDSPSVENQSEAQKQSIRLPDAGSSTLEMEVRVAETLSLIVNSEEIDLKKAIHSGGLEVKIDTNGGASVKYSGGKQGVNLKGLDLVGLNKDLFKKLNVGLKRNDAGGVDWSVRVGSKGNYVKLKGSLDLNPMNGILGPSLERMKNTSAGNL